MESARPASHVVRGLLVRPDAVEGGVVMIDDGWITYVGPAAAAPSDYQAMIADAPHPVAHQYILPGLVDIHCHGGGGVSFPDATSRTEAQHAIAEHRRHGTTTMLASLVTASPNRLIEQLDLLATLATPDATGRGEIAGIHCEGPFLSPSRRGAQSLDHLLEGDVGLTEELIAAGHGSLRTMTIAPEVAGLSVASALTEAGVIPSIGHTNATAAQSAALIRQVAPRLREQNLMMTATHLFNGMPPLHHRDPGPISACLAAAARGDLLPELVADGVHLSPELVSDMFDLLSGNVALVTDAMAAAGMPDGQYQLGPMDVVVAGGVARLTGPENSIAGGTAHLLDVVRRTVAGGVDLVAAVRSTSLRPARAIGLQDVGALEVGQRADLVCTDDDLRPVEVWRGGVRV